MSDLHPIEQGFIDSMAAGEPWFSVEFHPVQRSRADHQAAEAALERLRTRAKNLGYAEIQRPHEVEFHKKDSGKPTRAVMRERRVEFAKRTNPTARQNPYERAKRNVQEAQAADYWATINAMYEAMFNGSPFGRVTWDTVPQPQTVLRCTYCDADLTNGHHTNACPTNPVAPETKWPPIRDSDEPQSWTEFHEYGFGRIPRAKVKRNYTKDDERQAQDFIRRQQEQAAKKRKR